MTKKTKSTRPLLWLWKKGRKQVLLLGVVVFCNVLLAASSVWFALLVRDVIDSAGSAAENAAALQSLYTAAFILCGLILVQLALRFFCRYLGDKLTADYEISLRKHLYRLLLHKEFGALGAYHSGDLMTRLYSDVTIIADGAATILPNVAASATRLVCAIGVMAFLEWRFTLLFAVGGLILFVVSRLFSGKIKRLHKQMQTADGKARSFLQETFSGILVLKAFDAQEPTAKKADDLQEGHYLIRLKKKLIGALAGVGFAAIFKIGYFAALLYCSLALSGVIVSAGVMTYGTLMAILQLVNQIQAPFGSLSGILPKFYAMCASVERLQELEEIPDEVVGSAAQESVDEFYASLSSVRFDHVNFAYERDEILHDASLEIKKGDFCVITGLSGIGKSTLLKLMLGVYQPTDGEVYFSQNGQKTPIYDRAKGLFAYVPQGNLLFSGTIRENISFVRDSAGEEEIMEAARLACVTDFLSELPDGMDTMIGEKGFGLSEGQVQRIAIARALLHGAPILLLDESTSALDEQTEHRLLSSLCALKEKTLIIISHKKAAFEICDYEIAISDKRTEKRELIHESK